MPVETTVASYGDLAFNAALVIYLLAMVSYAVEYAAARSVAREASIPRDQEVAGPVGGVTTLAPPAPPEVAEPQRDWGERAGRVAVALSILAAGVHGASLLLRGLAADRVPWGNMYEFTSAICFCAVVAWLIVLARQARKAPAVGQLGTFAALRRLGTVVLLPIVVLLFLAGTVLYAEAAPLVPALDSYWIAIHVTAISIASGVFLLAGVASVGYLLGSRAESQPTSQASRLTRHLPASASLDRLAYRTTVVAFPIFTFAVMAGAIWAEAAWGRYWGWDPKETVALVSWVIYACYLHARATAGWRGAPSAWINVLGFASVLFNLFFVNMVIAGLHSYAGV